MYQHGEKIQIYVLVKFKSVDFHKKFYVLNNNLILEDAPTIRKEIIYITKYRKKGETPNVIKPLFVLTLV